jgi:protein CpxP
MPSVTRNKIYVFLIGILLLSNLALVAFFVWNQPPRKEVHRDRPGSYMQEALKNDVGFTDEQMTRFEAMATQHRQQMRPLFEDITQTKESFYRMLAQPAVSDSQLRRAAEQIGEKQELIDLKIFTHFQSIRQLCTPNQQPQFDSLIQHVVHKMIFPMRRGDGRKDSAAVKK